MGSPHISIHLNKVCKGCILFKPLILNDYHKEVNHFFHLCFFGQYARRKTFRGGLARIRADTRGLRPLPYGSAELPPKKISSELRRTSAKRSADSAEIRPNPRGLRSELAEMFARKISTRKNFPKISVCRGRLG